MKTIGNNALQAKHDALKLTTTQKNSILKDLAIALDTHKERIQTVNQLDVNNAREAGYDLAFVDRLILNDARIDGMIAGLASLINALDPIGVSQETIYPENGLDIERVSVPLGVIGIIYESRPNVTLDAFALCFKSSNVVILKGGKEAIETNTMLETIIQDVLIQHNCNPYLIQLIKDTSRVSTNEMMTMNGIIDVLIPRGSSGLIQTVVAHATIPVIETGAGNCHIYVDKDADGAMALEIIKNAKLQRLSVCNTMESLVVHQDIASQFLPMLIHSMPSVTFYGDEHSRNVVDILPAHDEDFAREYLAEAMSIKVVADIDEAIKHINHYSTHHSEAIITENQKTARQFQHEVDSAVVYVNASTRFTDGAEFGFGAEIGISTQKLHVRGPVGLRNLTSYKYLVHGNGHIRP